MRMIIEVQGYREVPIVTIGYKILGLPSNGVHKYPTEWAADDGSYYLDQYVNVLRPAKDEDRLETLPNEYPEFFI